MVEGDPLGRFLDLHHRGGFREMTAGREPDVLEEGTAEQQHQVGLTERLRICAASPGSERR